MRRLKSKGKSGKQSKRLSNPTCVFLLEFNKFVIKLEANRLIGVRRKKYENSSQLAEMGWGLQGQAWPRIQDSHV
tara:strand:+ start:2607 stop:2831 length:225 start_codon:yes stop_codon:yes gene_type:complete